MAKTYFYKAKKNRVFSLGMKFPSLKEKQLEFTDKDGSVLFGLDYEGTLFIRKDFAFDGVTPKFKLGFIIIGGWDGYWDDVKGEPQLFEATMKHDALTQILAFCIKNDIEIGLTYKDIDLIFQSDMIEAQFKYTKLYYNMVRFYDFIGRPSFLL